MSKVVDFLHASKVFYLATVDGDQAQVRPVSSVIEYNGKIYFETSSNKKMYHQMLKNPKIAISGMADSKWIRITGKAVMDNSKDAKEAMLGAVPSLKEVYNLDELVVYYIENMVASLCSFTDEPITLDN